MDDLIAERTFELKLSDGSVIPLRVGVDRPEHAVADENWSCRIYVEKPDKTAVRTAYGESSLQALLTALKFLRLEVAQLQAQHGADISFDGQADLWFGLVK